MGVCVGACVRACVCASVNRKPLHWCRLVLFEEFVLFLDCISDRVLNSVNPSDLIYVIRNLYCIFTALDGYEREGTYVMCVCVRVRVCVCVHAHVCLCAFILFTFVFL